MDKKLFFLLSLILFFISAIVYGLEDEFSNETKEGFELLENFYSSNQELYQDHKSDPTPIKTSGDIVNLNATGHDWFNYSSQKKYDLIYAIYEKTGIEDKSTDNIYEGTLMLTTFYALMFKQSQEYNSKTYWSKTLDMPVIETVPALMEGR